jgi:WD40 repeat protein
MPAQVGRFQVRGRLGCGAFGAVYRAHDPQLDRDVALKVAHAGTLADARATERFLREAKAAARLRHPHIVPVYDAGCEGGQHYIAAAFIEGRTLEDARCLQPLELRQAAQIVRALAEALDHAHRLGIVHRDVKPANVMLDPDGEPHLLDFGLAHRQEGADKLTQDGTVLGTPAYMAPEQAQGHSGEPQPASDQYSLGVVLYELLCGQTPFSGPPPIVLFNTLHTPPPSPRTLQPKVPRDLETICVKALAKRPEDRYASCQDMADDLRRWLEGEAIRARRLSVGERLARWFRREPVLALVTVGAALGLIAAAAVPLAASALLVAAEAREEEAHRRAEESEAEALRTEADANEQTQRAAAATREAQEAAKAAATETARARQASQAAKNEAINAREAIQEVEKRERVHRRYLYVADMNLAQQALADRQFPQVGLLLDRYRLVNGSEELRGFEWYHLACLERLAPSVQSAEQEGAIARIHFCGEGDRFLAASLIPRGGKLDLRIQRWIVWQPPLRPVPGEPFLFKGFTETPLFEKSPFTLSPDGKTVLQRSSTTTSELLDLQTGKTQARLTRHVRSVESETYSPDSKVLATVHADSVVRLWDLRTKKEPTKLQAPQVSRVAFSPDSKTLATGGSEVRLWEVSTGAELATLRGAEFKGPGLVFAPDGKVLAWETADGVQLWDVERGKERGRLRVQARDPNRGPAGGIVFAPNSQALATVARTRVQLWDAVSGAERGPGPPPGSECRSAAFSADGKLLAEGQADGTVVIRNVVDGSQRNRLTMGDRLEVLAFSPDGQVLVAGGPSGSLRVWGKDLFEQVTVLDGIEAPVTALAVRPDGQTLAIAAGKTVQSRQTATGALYRTLPDQPFDVLGVAGAAGGTFLAVGGPNGAVNVWDVATGTVRATLPVHTQDVRALAVAPDGKTVAIGRADGTIQPWDTTTAKERTSFKAHAGSVLALAYGRGESILASSGADSSVKLWDLATGNGPTNLKGHSGSTTALAFALDGKTLASGDADGSIKLWEVLTGEELLTLKGHTAAVTALAFAPDGTHLLSGSKDRTVRFWHAPRDLPASRER